VPTATLDGVELYYEERGSGRPMLLVAGIPAVAGDWAPLAEPLAESRRVVAFDNRGSGRSTITPGPYTTASLAADAIALLDHLGIDRFVEKKSRDVQDPEGYRAQIAAALSHDTWERLPQVDRPTLILTGDDDQVIPAAGSDVLHERIPDSLLYVVAGAGHLFFLERPDESLRAIQTCVPA
jgi:pimeloyl-ACP methyl ester carboxylesterase